MRTAARQRPPSNGSVSRSPLVPADCAEKRAHVVGPGQGRVVLFFHGRQRAEIVRIAELGAQLLEIFQ